jgi:NAD(P)-dependent dehydrogenase (short-subunit alcohol dehydrogenase family)
LEIDTLRPFTEGEHETIDIVNRVKTWYDFAGQTAVISGGTGFIGGQIACALASLGASVAILGRNLEAGERLRDRIQDDRRDALAMFVCDVLDRNALQVASDAIHKRFGVPDILVNAAGGNNPRATTTPQQNFFDLPPDALRWVFDLNLMGTVLPCQVFGQAMKERGRGSVLNVTSMAATRPLTRVGVYGAAKAAVSNFTQWLAVHLAQEYSPRIRVNAIAPGFLFTRQNRFLLQDEATGELTPRGQAIIDHTPMGRFGKPEDLLGATLWLLSPASSFVTGTVVPVDGGFGAYCGI